MTARQTYLTAGIIGLALVIVALILSAVAHQLDGTAAREHMPADAGAPRAVD